MSNQQFASIWDAIEDTPEQAENMKLRSDLMTKLKEHIRRTKMSQVRAAHVLGVTQPRVSDLMRGKINLFGLDALVNMAVAAGLHITMQIEPVDGHSLLEASDPPKTPHKAKAGSRIIKETA